MAAVTVFMPPLIDFIFNLFAYLFACLLTHLAAPFHAVVPFPTRILAMNLEFLATWFEINEDTRINVTEADN